MSGHRSLIPLLALGALAAIASPACSRQDAGPVAAKPPAAVPRASESRAPDENRPEIERWLAGLRAATAPLHDTASAGRAGWNARITGCMAMPDSGGMGYHYANNGLIDGQLQPFAPELLVFEPRPHGRLELVAVEYIVPFTIHPDTAAPPEIHGVKLHRNFDFGLWVLHAWVWKHNPKGVFSDWNPDVDCRFAIS